MGFEHGNPHRDYLYNMWLAYFCFLSALSLHVKMNTLDAASMILAFNWARCEIINYYGIAESPLKPSVMLPHNK